MPRKNKGGIDSIVSVPFRNLLTSTFSNTNNTAVFSEIDLVVANLGTRAAAIAPSFEFFRLKKLSAYQFCTSMNVDASNGQLSASHALSFIESNAPLTGTPTTLLQMSQFEKFVIGHPYTRLRMSIAKDILRATPLKWYNTASTGASTDALSCGIFVQAAYNELSAATSAAQCSTVIEGIVEFRGMITPALSFLPSQPSNDESDGDCEVLSLPASMRAPRLGTAGSAPTSTVASSSSSSKKPR